MPKIIPLEDEHIDIIEKTRNGLGLSNEELQTKAGISASELEAIQSGDPGAPGIEKVAQALSLNPTALRDAAQKSWAPDPIELEGLAQFNTVFFDMTVNAYVVWDSSTRDAVIFDSGADASVLLDFVKEKNLKVRLILITHTHGDHVVDVPLLVERTGAPVWVNALESLEGATPFDAGKTFAVGNLKIETRLTCGHAVGGTTFVIHGLSKPVAVVGDALFAGSMGGGKVSFADALNTTRKEIISLPDETILAPGHGPLTTVAEEKRHNSFFA